MVWQSTTIQEKGLLKLSTWRDKWWHLTCKDFGVSSLILIVFMQNTHGWEFASPWAHAKYRHHMFALAGKEFTEGPKSNLLLKAALTISSNQASQAFSQPDFENLKESTQSRTTQSSRKLVPKFDCPQNEMCFSFYPIKFNLFQLPS